MKQEANEKTDLTLVPARPRGGREEREGAPSLSASQDLPVSTKKSVSRGAIGLAIALLLLLVYGSGLFFFWGHFLPRSSVAEIDVSLMNLSALTRALDKADGQYSLLIKDKNSHDLTIEGSAIGLAYTDQDHALLAKKALRAQNAFLWPLGIFTGHHYPLAVSYDEPMLKAALNPILSQSQEPSDAKIIFSGDSYTVSQGDWGIKADQILSDVKGAISDQKSQLTLPDSDYTAPSRRTDDPAIKAACAKIDSYARSTVTYQVQGKEASLSKADIFSMIQIDENFNVSLRSDGISQFVDRLAHELNTYGSKRPFHTQKGDDIEVSGGTYGWVISKKKEIEQLSREIEAGQPVTREPNWEQTALGPIGDDIGKTYVELDYSNQHMYYVKDGSRVWESDIVSGNMSKGSGSPDGIFHIIYRKSPAVLKGEDYESPVQYFTVWASDVGFHDASWKHVFGGKEYLTRGSHGCINLPLEAAKWVYENIPDGTPVVSYYREPVELTTDNNRISNARSYVKK